MFQLFVCFLFFTFWGTKKKGVVKYNPTKAEMMAPLAGPAHPYHAPSFMPHLGAAAHANGAIAPTSVAAWAFEEQFHTYNSYGYAIGTGGEVPFLLLLSSISLSMPLYPG